MKNKRKRFKKLATYRTNQILKKIDILGNCSNQEAYEYNEKEIEKIFSAIRKKVNQVEGSLLGSLKKNSEFNLE